MPINKPLLALVAACLTGAANAQQAPPAAMNDDVVLPSGEGQGVVQGEAVNLPPAGDVQNFFFFGAAPFIGMGATVAALAKSGRGASTTSTTSTTD